jgi:hypothetical protein
MRMDSRLSDLSILPIIRETFQAIPAPANMAGNDPMCPILSAWLMSSVIRSSTFRCVLRGVQRIFDGDSIARCRQRYLDF